MCLAWQSEGMVERSSQDFPAVLARLLMCPIERLRMPCRRCLWCVSLCACGRVRLSVCRCDSRCIWSSHLRHEEDHALPHAIPSCAVNRPVELPAWPSHAWHLTCRWRRPSPLQAELVMCLRKPDAGAARFSLAFCAPSIAPVRPSEHPVCCIGRVALPISIGAPVGRLGASCGGMAVSFCLARACERGTIKNSTHVANVAGTAPALD